MLPAVPTLKLPFHEEVACRCIPACAIVVDALRVCSPERVGVEEVGGPRQHLMTKSLREDVA